MGSRKRPEADDKEQFARFIETAERMAEDAQERFEEAFKKIINAKPGKSGLNTEKKT
ncbi:MAG: hypothetical protein ACLQPD_26115 [Desulfomonilaceae bacterium]